MFNVVYFQVMKKAVYRALDNNLQRRYHMARLHIFPDDKVPKEMLANVSNQIRPVRPIPKRLDEYDPEFMEKFPKIIDLPKNYVLR